MSLMGIDIGSSRCKVVVFSVAGKVLAEAMADYAPSYPGTAMVEMRPEVFWEAAISAIRKAAVQVEKDPVQALTISSHAESFVPLDRNNVPLGPVILNADNRATAEAKWWENLFGRKRIFEITGLVVHPMYPMSKIRWLRNHQPDLFNNTARFAGVTDYLLLRLGLEPYMDYSHTSRYMAFDVRARKWSEEMLSACELSADKLPIPVQAGTVAGRLSASAAKELGLKKGVLVAVGGHDQPCGALGMGAIGPGMVTDSMGTYECLVAVSSQPTLDDIALSASLNSYCHVVPDEYITIAYFPSGIMVKWFCDNFCGEDATQATAIGQDLYSYMESKTPSGPTGLSITPHLIGSCNPHFDPRATGTIVGLTPTSNRYQVYKGILEGLACELGIVADLLAEAVGSYNEIRASGGGARSKLGLNLRAAITGKSIKTLKSQEAVCLGAAFLAGVAAGIYSDLAEASKQVVQVAETVRPDPDMAAAYQTQAQRYRLLYPALAPLRQL